MAVLRVVTSNNSEVFRHLGSRALLATGVEHTVATDYHSALELIRTKRPQVAIIDVELPNGDGYQLCREVKDDPDLAEVRVILVLSSVVTRGQLERLSACGCDDVLALPVRSEDFFHHIVQVAGLPHRRNDRIEVGLDVELEVRGAWCPARVENLSLGGLGIRCESELADGQAVTFRLIRGGKTYPEGNAVVAWSRSLGPDKRLAGLRFSELPFETKLLVEELCLFELTVSPEGGVIVHLHGDIVESTDFSALIRRLADEDPIELNLREVRYLSSTGVRIWCRFLAALAGKRYVFRHASLAFASQAAMVPMAVGDGEILSFEAPYHCELCERDDVRLLESKSVLHDREEIVPPTLHCYACKGELLFDDLPWRYFAFIVRQTAG